MTLFEFGFVANTFGSDPETDEAVTDGDYTTASKKEGGKMFTI